MATWQHRQGRVINGRFSLQQYLGGSERSAVYLTEINGSNAAIKLIPADAAYAQAQVSQWQLARDLSHPHLIRILEMGRHVDDQQDVFFAVMELADENLADVVPGRARKAIEAHQMLGPMLEALNYLHWQNIVHGNIKPANIMAVDNQLKLSSDGLRPVGKLQGPTGIGNKYDAPELANGEISPSADIWSLGMVLVEALTNDLPAWDTGNQNDPRLPDYVPQPFHDIAKHCLRRDRGRRWSITEIRKRLEQSPVVAEDYGPPPETPAIAEVQNPPAPAAYKEAHSPLVKTTSERPELPAKWRGSRRAAAVIIAPVVIAAGVLLWHNRSETPQPAALTSKQQTATTAQPIENASSSAAGMTDVGNDHAAVTHKVLPEVSRKARERIIGTIKAEVKVAVDSSGTVSHATLVSHKPRGHFANQALKAARKWTFAPPRVGGRATPSEWILRFDFTKNGVEAVAQRTSPGA